MKKLFFILLFISCGTGQLKKVSQTTQIEYMKDYFFCRCISHAYNNEFSSEIWKNDISQGVLFDIGNMGVYYKTLDSLAKIKAQMINPTQINDYQNKKPVIMKCLKFMRELNVKEIIKSDSIPIRTSKNL